MTCCCRPFATAMFVLATLSARSAFALPDFTYDFEGLQADQSIIGQDQWMIHRTWLDVRVEVGPGGEGCGTLTAVGEIPSSGAKGAQRALDAPFVYGCNDQHVVWRYRGYIGNFGGPPQNRGTDFYVSSDPTPSPNTHLDAAIGFDGLNGGPVQTYLYTEAIGHTYGDVLSENTCYDIELRVDFSQQGGVATMAYRDLDAGETEFTVDSVQQAIPLGLPTDPAGRYTVRHVVVRVGSGAGFRNYMDDLFLKAPLDCDADFNCDALVGIDDFLQLLAAWGPCSGCIEDISGDGVVGIIDFLVLLSEWGPCE